jgi:hypothetical protein
MNYNILEAASDLFMGFNALPIGTICGLRGPEIHDNFSLKLFGKYRFIPWIITRVEELFITNDGKLFYKGHTLSIHKDERVWRLRNVLCILDEEPIIDQSFFPEQRYVIFETSIGARGEWRDIPNIRKENKI